MASERGFKPLEWRPKPEDGSDELWTLQQMCDYLQIPIGTARKWIVEHKGPATLKVGKHRRVRKYAVLKWIWEQEQAEFR